MSQYLEHVHHCTSMPARGDLPRVDRIELKRFHPDCRRLSAYQCFHLALLRQLCLVGSKN